MLLALIFARAQRASTYDISAKRNVWLQSALHRLRSSAIIWKQVSLRSSAIVCDHMETSLQILALDFYGVIVDSAFGLINYHLTEISSS